MANRYSNGIYGFKNSTPISEPSRTGSPDLMANMSYSPNQRVINQMNTANQVSNYAAAKEIAEQGRTDMRGNIAGYYDTLG